MNAILEQINSIGKVFVEFALPMLVQSGVLTAVLLLADLALRRKVRAVFRYWLWMLVLAKLILPASLSSPVSIGHLVGNELQSVKISMPEIIAAPQAAEPVSIETANREFIVPQKSASEPAAVQPKIIVTPVTWQGVVFLVWLAVVIAMGLLLLQRAVFVCGLVAQAKEADSLMNDTLKFCCGQMGLKGRVGLKISANATSPTVCGLFRPVILVPESLGTSLGVGHLRMVLLHELAHIKRGDLWANLVQTILQIIYFYNPLLWLANAVIRRIREQAVDEMVQVAMGDNANLYPQTLLDVAKLAFRRPALSLRLIGVVESKSALKGRIKRMLDRPIPKSAKLGILGLAVILIIGAVLLPMAKAAKLERVQGNEKNTNNDSKLEIGGIVKDKDGQPITEAMVDVLWDIQRAMPMFDDEQTVSDKEGKWKCKIPVDVREVNLRVEHKGFVKQTISNINVLFLDGDFTTVMKKGFELRGQVNDGGGIPVADALLMPPGSVSLISAYTGVVVTPSMAKTNSDGSFVLSSLSPGQNKIVVASREFAAKLITVNVEVENKPLTVTLDKGKAIAGRIVDSNGSPVEGATLRCDRWKLPRGSTPEAKELVCMIDYEEYNLLRLETTSDKNGNFIMESCPNNGLLEILIKKEGFLITAPDVNVTESKPYVFTLYNLPVIEGTVLDNQTGKPIQEFEITEGFKWHDSENVSWLLTSQTIKSAEGSFKAAPSHFASREPQTYGAVRILADGYLPVTILKRVGEKPQPVTVRLNKAEPISGNIIDTQGKAVEAAEIAWVGPKQKAYIRNDRIDVSVCDGPEYIVQSDANGFFKLPPSSEEGEIVALHEKGYAHRGVDKYGSIDKLVLIPWSKIQGRLHGFYTEEKNISVGLSPHGSGDLRNLKIVWLTANMSDSDGNFDFKYVPSIPMTISVPKDQNNWIHSDVFSPEPGKEYTVTVESEGKFEWHPNPKYESRANQNPAEEVEGTAQPMLKAEKESASKEEEPQFIATLANGVTVELVGICEYPSEGKKWWQPDGTELAEQIHLKRGDVVAAKGQAFAFVAKAIGLEDMTLTWGEIAGSRGTASLTVVDSDGKPIKDMVGLKVHIDETLSSTSISVGIPTGDWETKAEHDGKTIMSTGFTQGGVTFSEAYESDEGVKIIVSDDLGKVDHRIAAIDSDGNILQAVSKPWVGAGKIRQTTAHFENLRLDQIKEFQFQTRPYEWVTFKNVSLRPGVKTDVQVEVSKSPLQTKGGKRFGAAIENVLPVTEGRSEKLLDIDTGRWGTKADFGENDRETHKWVRDNGLDLLGFFEKEQFGLLAFDMAVLPAKNTDWERLTAEEVVANWSLAQMEANKITPMTPMEAPDRPATYLFRTRENGIGILQIVDFTDNPKGVKIRYKIVEGTGSENPDVQVEVENPSGQVISASDFGKDDADVEKRMAKAAESEKVDRRSTGKSRTPARSTMPRVVRTTPAAYANDVSAELDKITVTFDQPMLDQSWSWTGSGETYPQTPGRPYYDSSRTICTLPVKLEAGKVYWVGINSPSYRNFKSADGAAAKRYVILFATRGADGKPTPIPQDLLDKAKRINEAPEEKSSGVKDVDVERRRTRLRAAFNRRMAKDKAIYSEQELDEIEQLYQIANKKWKSREAQDSLEKLIARYARANRTGCAILYLGQMSDGEQKEQYLKRAIDDFSDCMYGDGVRVGAFARYLLAMHYKEIDKKDEAKRLIAELIKDYPDAVGHNGKLLTEQIPEDMLAQAKVVNEQVGKADVQVEVEKPAGYGDERLIGAEINAKGQRIIKEMAEVNRYWLIGPSWKVLEYSYDFTLHTNEGELDSNKSSFNIINSPKLNPAVRQGITYYSALHKLVDEPSSAYVTKIEEENGSVIRLDFTLYDPVMMWCGNGISERWFGSFNREINYGKLWLDIRKKVPIKIKSDYEQPESVEEQFSEYASLGDDAYVPLRIMVDKGDMHFDFNFNVFGPGLWLFDKSSYRVDGRRNLPLVASVDNVQINGKPVQAKELAQRNLKESAGQVESAAQPMEESAKLEKVDQNPTGKWQSVDFVQEIEDFEPGEKSWSGELYLKDVEFKKGGRTSGPWTWKEGSLWHPGDRTKARYVIKEAAGVKYLFMEWISGDVTIRGQKPWYYVMEQVGGETAQPEHKQIVKQAEPVVLAREFVGLLVKEDFSAATKSFDATMRQAMPPEKLADAWKGLVGQSGAFKKEIGTRTEKMLGFDIVYVTCEFEKGPLDIKVVYNSERQVSGLWFVPVPQ